jgi:hypothetical protein
VIEYLLEEATYLIADRVTAVISIPSANRWDNRASESNHDAAAKAMRETGPEGLGDTLTRNRVCVKLGEIQYACYLNDEVQPSPVLWENETEYPGVAKFAQGMKEALMRAHDAIIEARVGQAKQANRHRRSATFQVNDLVYLTTKNLRIPKGRACKLIPKFIGPFRIAKVITEGSTYRLDLSAELRSRGVHDAFHASLLRPHWPNDDRRFPGRHWATTPNTWFCRDS